jgi:hypothetical protein
LITLLNLTCNISYLFTLRRDKKVSDVEANYTISGWGQNIVSPAIVFW